MGQKDLAQNDYFNDKARFADVCNGILFQGQDFIKPEELQETDADIVYREEKGKLRKIIPDKVRIWRGSYLSIIALENQSMVDYHMVFRTMKTEAVSYERQWRKREKKYRKEGILLKDKPLCWCKTEEKFIPVITIVIYMGTDKEWDGATCLYDMLDIGKELEPYVSNYKMNLFDCRNCTDFSIFKTENRELFEMISSANDKEKMNELISVNRERYNKLDAETTDLICEMASIDKEKIKRSVRKNRADQAKVKESMDMWKAWEDHKESGRKEATLNAIESVIDSLKVSVSQAMDILKIPESEQEQYLKLLK